MDKNAFEKALAKADSVLADIPEGKRRQQDIRKLVVEAEEILAELRITVRQMSDLLVTS